MLSLFIYSYYTLKYHPVIMDLFIRLGYITPDNEPDYMKIVTRLHGSFDFDRW